MTMKLFKFPKKPTFLLLILFLFANFAAAQKANNPRRENLLNGLRILIWNAPASDKITIKLRIHSGSAFDGQGKEGTMALLGDILFPSEEFKRFFEEDLGGTLEVTSNYDYIQINATGDKKDFLTILETVANAVSTPEISKETTAAVRAKRLEIIKVHEQDQKYIADQAARKRLLGTYPYGRPPGGNAESLAKIDFADVLFAKQRFLSSDNATLAIIGGDLKSDFIMRAVRRYFGNWKKSDGKIPATFTQPEKPDEKPFGVQTEYGENSQIRYALRGLARNDKDFHASQILTKVLQNRLQTRIPNNYGKEIFVKQEASFLPGVIFFGYTSTPAPIVAAPLNPTPGKTENIVTLIMTGDVSAEEFDRAKTEYLNESNKNDFVEDWLDIDTYKLSTYKDESKSSENVTLVDINRTLERLRKEPMVSISVMKKPDETTDENQK